MPTSKTSNEEYVIKLERLQAENKRLNSLLEVTQSLSSVIDLDSLLFRIMDVVRENLYADRCTVFLLDTNTNELWSKAAIGLKNEIRFPADLGIAGHVNEGNPGVGSFKRCHSIQIPLGI